MTNEFVSGTSSEFITNLILLDGQGSLVYVIGGTCIVFRGGSMKGIDEGTHYKDLKNNGHEASRSSYALRSLPASVLREMP